MLRLRRYTQAHKGCCLRFLGDMEGVMLLLMLCSWDPITEQRRWLAWIVARECEKYFGRDRETENRSEQQADGKEEGEHAGCRSWEYIFEARLFWDKIVSVEQLDWFIGLKRGLTLSILIEIQRQSFCIWYPLWTRSIVWDFQSASRREIEAVICYLVLLHNSCMRRQHSRSKFEFPISSIENTKDEAMIPD